MHIAKLLPYCLNVLFLALELSASSNSWLNEYTVTWNSQSQNSSESMPCGGGDIGLNVWVEQGDLLFYIDRSGNLDENDQLRKNGRVRIEMDPSPFTVDGRDIHFEQKLDLQTGAILIEGESAKNHASIRVWVEVHRPVIHIELESQKASTVTATFESWRNEKQLIPRAKGRDYNRWAAYGYCTYEGEVFSYPDDVSFTNDQTVLFYHKNGADRIFDKEVKLQRLEGVLDQMHHTTRDRIFGGIIFGDNFVAASETSGIYTMTPYRGWQLKSKKPTKSHHVQIALHTQQTENLSDWLAQLDSRVAEKVNSADAWAKNQAWWTEFWNRSHVIINKGRGPDDIGWQVGRNYQLMRYMLGCNAYGEFPTHFNGGLFIFDHFYVDGKKGMDPSFYNADYRKWGAWTGMNQRLVHWPFLKSGDFEEMRPQFNFYRNNLINAQLRNQVSFGIDGCSFAEQVGSGGLPNGYHYGWEEPFGKRKAQHEVGMQHHHTHYFHTQLEFAYMIHEWHRFTGADISEYLPFLKDTVIFHFEYHKMLQQRRNGQDWDAAGRLVLKGMQATETYKFGSNPSLEVAGLRQNLKALLDLPEAWVSSEEKALFRDWQERVPELSFRTRNGHKTISPLAEAAPSSRLCNREIPQLYPVYPYGMYALGLPELDVGINTWKYGLDQAGDTYLGKMFGVEGYPQRRAWWGWGQQAIFLARLGLTDEAKNYVSKKLGNAQGDPHGRAKPSRFPAFWGPGFGCMPSMEWGTSGMIAVQEMLLQTIAQDGRELRILPTWPTNWDVDFKLHAPENTTVACIFENGKITKRIILPLARAEDVVIGQN